MEGLFRLRIGDSRPTSDPDRAPAPEPSRYEPEREAAGPSREGRAARSTPSVGRNNDAVDPREAPAGAPTAVPSPRPSAEAPALEPSLATSLAPGGPGSQAASGPPPLPSTPSVPTAGTTAALPARAPAATPPAPQGAPATGFAHRTSQAAPAPAAAPASGSGPAPAARAAAGAPKAPPPPAEDPERVQAVFRELRLHVAPGTRHAVIQLQPAELGRITVRITVRGSRVTGEVRAESEETLRILEAHAPELRATLAQSGFDTTDLSLARHGDPSPRRSDLRPPLSETRGRPGVSSAPPAPVAAVVAGDRIDTYA